MADQRIDDFLVIMGMYGKPIAQGVGITAGGVAAGTALAGTGNPYRCGCW